MTENIDQNPQLTIPRVNRCLLVLVGCEESQTVCKTFRALGHEAYSCDLLPCSGGKPEWHNEYQIPKGRPNNTALLVR